MNKPVDRVLIETLSDKLTDFIAEEASGYRLPETVGKKDQLYLAYQSMIDVCIDLLRETRQIHYIETCKAVLDAIDPLNNSISAGLNSGKVSHPTFEDNRNYRKFLKDKSLVFIYKSTTAQPDDAVFVLAILRTGLQGLMKYHGPEEARRYARKRLGRLSVGIVRI